MSFDDQEREGERRGEPGGVSPRGAGSSLRPAG